MNRDKLCGLVFHSRNVEVQAVLGGKAACVHSRTHKFRVAYHSSSYPPLTPCLGISIIIIIIIHKFSIVLFPTEQAQRACSHTCT